MVFHPFPCNVVNRGTGGELYDGAQEKLGPEATPTVSVDSH